MKQMNIEKISTERMNPSEYNPRKDLKPGDAEYEKHKFLIIYQTDDSVKKSVYLSIMKISKIGGMPVQSWNYNNQTMHGLIRERITSSEIPFNLE